MSAVISESLPRFTAETLKLASKQSQRCHVIPLRLRSAIDRFIKEQDDDNMSRGVLRLSRSYNQFKEDTLLLSSSNSTPANLMEDPFKAIEHAQRWKMNTTSRHAISIQYQEEQALAYVAARMPSVYSALYRVLSEVRRRVPELAPAKVLDFGAGTGSALWAMMEVWPGSVKKLNMVEPSQSMQRAGQSLVKGLGLEELPFIQSYDSIQSLSKDINKSGRKHDLVIASYVLGELPSLEARISLVRQLWDLTGDILVLVEPGTPEGSNIISQMRSHILWMEERKSRKLRGAANKDSSKDLMTLGTGAFIVAPCPHDGPCPLLNTSKYCHFVQRVERTHSQRVYKRLKGMAPLRGYEDEKFSYVAFRRGTRPREAWPLDGMKFQTYDEMRADRIPVDLELEMEFQYLDELEEAESDEYKMDAENNDSDLSGTGEATENEATENDEAEEDEEENDVEEEEGEDISADLGTGWGRIIFMPFKRGKRVELDMCRATNAEGTEGSFNRVVITKRKNPTLHHQARRSMWGDLWPLRSGNIKKFFM